MQKDVMISAIVDCGGMEFEVHLTLAARDDLQLSLGKNVWVVVKTHSCHLMGDVNPSIQRFIASSFQRNHRDPLPVQFFDIRNCPA